MTATVIFEDGQQRCKWSAAAPEFIKYHDEEWGYPVNDDRQLFEKLCLESFQSGLSWRTILAKRDNFRTAFQKFDFNKIAEFTEDDVERLLQDKGIIRHRGKIKAVINNAKCAQQLVKNEGSLAHYFWRFEPKLKNSAPQSRSTSEESILLAKALKKQGWKFVGPTTIYAFMQAMGLINDHAEGCIIHKKIESARKDFIRP